MTVRPARHEDFAAVSALLEELGRAKVTPETRESVRALYEAQVGDPGSSHLVAEDEVAVIAFCSLHFRERLNHAAPQAWIPDLIVAASARRRGAGGALLAEASRLARERGCWDITLESGHQRRNAHELYRAQGYLEHGLMFRKEP